MSAQDLEQRARELLAAESRGRREADTMLGPDVASEAALRAIVAALRQQPAPVDLEQFREAVKQAYGYYPVVVDGELHNQRDADRFAGFRLLSIIDNAGEPCPCGEPTCTESWEPGCGLGESVEHAVPAEREPPRGDELRAILAHQPAPVVDDAMVRRALNARVRNWPIRQLFDSDYEARIAMRAALTVALAQGVQS